MIIYKVRHDCWHLNGLPESGIYNSIRKGQSGATGYHYVYVTTPRGKLLPFVHYYVAYVTAVYQEMQ